MPRPRGIRPKEPYDFSAALTERHARIIMAACQAYWQVHRGTDDAKIAHDIADSLGISLTLLDGYRQGICYDLREPKWKSPHPRAYFSYFGNHDEKGQTEPELKPFGYVTLEDNKGHCLVCLGDGFQFDPGQHWAMYGWREMKEACADCGENIHQVWLNLGGLNG